MFVYKQNINKIFNNIINAHILFRLNLKINLHILQILSIIYNVYDI